jgi:heptosyltransferase I
LPFFGEAAGDAGRRLGFGSAGVTLPQALGCLTILTNHNIDIALFMPRILLIKTSSLGDVVHNFPVVGDIREALGGDAEIHWVVEETLADLPRLHPGVARTLPAAVRRWRRSWWRRSTHAEVAAFLRELRAVRYDAVIDTQGLLKSALIARAARGPRYGYDWPSSREPLRIFYARTFRVPRKGHAVERNRALAAGALHYTPRALPDYGIAAEARRAPWLPGSDYVVFVHATSAQEKLWAEERWVALGEALALRHLTACLPWGSAEEHARSLRLAASIPGALVPPRLTVSELASVLAAARCTVGLDTGLTHLAGALGTPTVGVYTATDPALTGLYGCRRAENVGGRGAEPRVASVLEALKRVSLQ